MDEHTQKKQQNNFLYVSFKENKKLHAIRGVSIKSKIKHVCLSVFV